MKKWIKWLLIGGLAVGCAAIPKKADLIYVRCGHLIDGLSASVQVNAGLIISRDRIEAVGENLPVPQGAKVIDLSAYTCLPGLIDMHTHLTAEANDSADLKAHMLMPKEQILERARANAKTTLLSGFTTVRDLGTYHGGVNLELRDEIAVGKTQGPRVQAAPVYLTVPDGGGDLGFAGVETPHYVRLGVARGAEEFRRRAELAAQMGADILKVIASGAVLAPQGTPGAPEMTVEELKAVVGVAKRQGLRVAAHAHGAQSIKDSILAGVNTIEHASLIDDEGIRLAKKHGVALAMDIFNGDFIDQDGRRQNWPKAFIEKNLQVMEKQRRSFTKAQKAGVPMVFATDAGVFPWGQAAKQFLVMVKWGMSPMAAIQSATSVAARYMGWSADVGSVTAGRFADLIAVKGDPLKDIAVLEKVAVVIKAGRLVSAE